MNNPAAAGGAGAAAGGAAALPQVAEARHFTPAGFDQLNRGGGMGVPMNPYAKLAFAKAMDTQSAGSPAHILPPDVVQQIVAETPVTATRMDSSGGIYQGTWDAEPLAVRGGGRARRKSGYGRHRYANGDRYEGEWHDGLRHGQGRWSTPANVWAIDGTGRLVDGAPRFDTYEGGWENDMRHGNGVLTLARGSTYVGDFIRGKKHGQGRMRQLDPRGPVGDLVVYEGEWADNRRHGQGTLSCPVGHSQFPDGLTQTGTWVRGEFQNV